MKKGEITAFLSLVFLLMLSFIGAMIESASIQVLKNYKRAETSLAMESLFAEYQRQLLEEYDIFALDEKNMMKRLAYYGVDEDESKVENFELLADQCGKAFYEQAVRYMENKLGFDFLKKEEEESELWEKQESDRELYQQKKNNISGGLESMLEGTGEELPEENNPIQSITDLKKSGLLQIIVPNPEQLSNKKLEKDQLVSVRKRKTGNLTAGEFSEKLSSKLLFHSYLMEHFGDYTDSGKEKTLEYEMEYLLGGKMSDRENLEAVIDKILALRFAVNYGYLLTDEVKRAEAEVLALTLCSLLTVPGVAEAVKQAILAAWAYGESIVDLHSLFCGKKVAAVKSAETWTLQLSGLLALAGGESLQESSDCENGMTYQDYLKGLLVLEKSEVLTMRALDLIGSDLQIRADHLVTKLEVKSDCKLRRGIHYEFLTYFGYQ